MTRIFLSFLTFIVLITVSKATEITIYAASDLIYAFEEVKRLYESKYQNDKLKIVYVSSGKGYNKIVNGAPYDIVFSANMDYVERLKKEGFVISDIKPYAVGRIVIWALKSSDVDVSKGVDVLLDPKIKRISVANWEHAPYGVSAKQCLEYYGIFNKVKNKLVLGENISQTAQYIEIGSVDVGIIALSLAKGEKLLSKGNYYLLPENCHQQILQGSAILKNALKDKERYKTAKRFFEFINSPEVRKIMNKYGFILPGEKNE